MRRLLFIFLPLTLLAQTASPTVQKRLDELHAAYAAAYQKEVAAIHQTAVANLDAKYIAALERALAAATQAGQLDTAVALRDEKKRLTEKSPLPADDFAAPETLKTLRLTYRSALASLEVKRDQLITPIKAKYDQALDALQTELTKAADLDGAIAIRAVREALKNEKVPEMPKVVVEEPSKPAPPAPPPVKPTKEDDPVAAMQLADWAFACQRSVLINQPGVDHSVEVKSAADFPASEWSLKIIAAANFNPAAPEIFPWELLPKVPGLMVLGVHQKQPLTAEQATHLQALPNLIKFDIGNMRFTLGALQAMPIFKRVDHLRLGFLDGDIAEGMKLIAEKFPGLPILDVGFEIPVELLPAPKSPLYESLQEISLKGHVSPEIVAKLADMPKLKSLGIKDSRDATLPPDLLLPMKHYRYLKLLRCKAVADLLPSLKKFDQLDLVVIQMSPSDPMSPSDLEPLGELKSRRFELDGGTAKSISDEHVEAISQMKGVKEMRLVSHSISPAGIDQIKKALPKCKITH